MDFLNVNIPIKNKPVLDEGFVPLGLFFKHFEENATKPVVIAVERTNGLIGRYDTKIFGTEDMKEADCYYIERLVKMMLWAKGGFRVYVCGDETVGEHIKEIYRLNGKRHFDADYMSSVFESEFEVIIDEIANAPEAKEDAKAIGGHMDGCRIGFDAGGSDRKVSAVIDGECVYSEEVVWFPKITEDPDYHYGHIVEAMKTAASKMPRVDAIGISSAGVYINNRTMNASLFLKVPKDLFDAKVKDIYLRAAAEFGDVPVEVVNDGDVTALAGAIGLGDNAVLGIAMGTSEAVGYVNEEGKIMGWLNELAFAPVDGQPDAMEDEWSGDIGCGVKYFSQDSVIKLAPRAGIELKGESPAEKLKEVQALMANDDERAIKVYESIGTYLGHTLPLYAMFYDIRHVLMLGRVMSGKGGDIIMAVADKVMTEEYPDIKFRPETPDEKTRRVGQSVIAASLPKINK